MILNRDNGPESLKCYFSLDTVVSLKSFLKNDDDLEKKNGLKKKQNFFKFLRKFEKKKSLNFFWI